MIIPLCNTTHSSHIFLMQVNQIGSVTESIEAVRMSKKAGWGVMASHRRFGSGTLKLAMFYFKLNILHYLVNVFILLCCSGETEDTFIADLSVGLATVTYYSNALSGTMY